MYSVFFVAYFSIYVSGIEAPSVQGGETLAVVVVSHLFHLSELHGVDRWEMALYVKTKTTCGQKWRWR